MFFAFNWAFETKGTSGFVDFGSGQGKPDGSANAVSLNPKSPASPSRLLPPKSYRDVAVGTNERASFRPKGYRDVGIGADIRSPPAHPKSFHDAGTETRSPIRPKGPNARRSVSTQTTTSMSVEVQADDRNKNSFPYDADRRVKAFEDRVIGLDEQLSLIQKMVNDTLNGQRNLEQEVQSASEAALQLKNAREEWQTRSSALSDELSKARTENSVLDGQLVQALADYSVVDDQLNKTRATISALEDNLSKARADYSLLDVQLSNARVDNSMLDSQLSRAQAGISKLEDQLTKVQMEYSTLEKQLNKERVDKTTFNNQLTQSLGENSALNGQIIKLRSDWEALESQLSKTRADYSELSSQLTKTRTDYAILDGELSKARAHNSTLDSQLANTRSDYEALENKLDRTRSDNSVLDEQLTQARGNCSVLDGQLAKARADITVLDKQLNDARAEISKILTDHQQENKLFEEKCRTEWESKTGELQAQLNEAHKRIQELKEALSSAVSQGNLDTRMSQYQDELQKERIRIQQLLDSYIKDKGSLHDEYHQLVSKTTELQERLGSAVDEARNEIRSYLEKTTAYDKDMKSSASMHLQELKDALKSNLELWNEHITQKAALSDLLERERERMRKFYEEKQGLLLEDHQEEKRVLKARYESLKENFQQEKDRIHDEKRALESQYDRLKAEKETALDERNKLHQDKLTLGDQHERFKVSTQQESERLQSELRLLEDKFSHLQRSSQQERERLQDERRLIDNRYDSLSENAQKERSKLQDEKRVLEDQHRLLTTEKETAEQEGKRLSDEQLKLEDKYNRLKTETGLAEEESTRIRNDLETKYGRVQAENESIDQEMKRLRDGKMALEDSYNNLGEEYETMETERKSLEDDCSAKDQELMRRQAQADELATQLRNTKAQLDNSSKQIEDKELEIMNLKTEIGRLQANVKSFQEIIQANDQANDEAIQVRSTELSLHLEQEREGLQKEQQRAQNLEATVTELRRIKETQGQELEGLKQKLQDVKIETNEKLTSHEMEMKRKDAEVVEWTQKLQKLEEEAQNETLMRISAEKSQQEATLAMEKMARKLLLEETRRRELFEQVQDLRGNIRVMCRIRPVQEGDGTLLEYKTKPGKFHNHPAGLELVKHKERADGKLTTENTPYEFERVFTPEEPNETVFSEISQLVQSFIDGKRICIFCYGQTGTGKTYTMSNEADVEGFEEDHDETDGIIPRTKTMAFREADRLRQLGRSVEVKGCCYEIYLDKLYLLNNASRGPDANLGQLGKGLGNRTEKTFTKQGEDWIVKDAQLITLESARDFDKMYSQAMASRQFRSTKQNDQSSRSHFIVRLEFTSKTANGEETYSGILNLVDLAGSERRKTAGTEGQGLAEGIAINESLSVLKSVLLKLKEGDKPSEYREKGGTLSKLLQPSLGTALGNKCMTLMFVMINLRERDLEISKGSLEYAMTAQKVTSQTKSSNEKKKRIGAGR